MQIFAGGLRAERLCLVGLGTLFLTGTIATTALGQAAQTAGPDASIVTIPAQVPLRIETDRRTKLKRGAVVTGTLLESVYVGTDLVLPAGSPVAGHVIETAPVERGIRTAALLDGDFTPLHQPVVSFDAVRLPTGATVPMQTVAHLRQASLIRFVPRQKQSIFQRLKGMAGERIKAGTGQVSAPHKSDRLLSLVYRQLPYHPQRIWANTDFDAELQSPLSLHVPMAEPVVLAPSDTLLHEKPIVRGRLIQEVNSDKASNGDAVHAVLTEPVYDKQHELIFPEGAELTGVVLQARPAKSFGRNGALRFAFRSMQPVNNAAQSLQGQVTGAEGAKDANMTVDEEGGVHANPDKDRFVAPLLLAVLAAGGHDDDGGSAQQGLASNGLGIVVRLVGFTAGSRNFATGVGAYGVAKSIYRHFLAHGKPVIFPQNTAVEVQLSSRQ